MKKLQKLCGILVGPFLSNKSAPNGFGVVSCIAVAMSFAFWMATTSLAQEKSEKSETSKANDAKGKGPPAGKCIVCHNPHNFHQISIPCNQVDKFLSHHPGDFRGPCNVTPHTNR
jgi:hypothetical protein